MTGEPDGPAVDYRFTLANERTYLAWLRTALAVLAGAVLVGQHATSLGSARHVVAAGVCIAAGCLAVMSLARWRRNQSAIERGVDLPGSGIGLSVTLAVVVVACLCAALFVRQ